MKIVTLVENEAIDNSLKHVHGLSLYIEWMDKKILFDVGPNRYFLSNAKKLGIDISAVDMLIISHGHYDHGLGLKFFIRQNKRAKIYIARKAFEKQAKKIGFAYLPIGLKKPKNLERFVFIDKDVEIVKDMMIYTGVLNKEKIIGDNSLYTYDGTNYVLDTFEHEIYLVIREGSHNVLFSGCSHKGIENIIKHIERLSGEPFTDVIGGFHLSHYHPDNIAEKEYLKVLSDKLTNSRNTHYYSCHCTGNTAYEELEKHMGKKLHRLKTGDIIDL